MNLNIDYLLKKLKNNIQEILFLIDTDPLLTHRQCPKTGLWISNASKELYTPEKEHQLYAKGIVYKKTPELFCDPGGVIYKYELISLPLLKIYNYGENVHVNKHVKEMIGMNCSAFFMHKYDGTMIQRFEYEGEIYFATRGMIETMLDPGDENNIYFEMTRKVLKNKYPHLLKNGYDWCTDVFELIGPGNRIVTKYDDWDLIYIASFDKQEFGYDTNETLSLSQFDINGFRQHKSAEYFTISSFDNAVEVVNKKFEGTDNEGVVVQFETKGQFPKVIGRVKIKTDEYRKLLKLYRNCSYKTVEEIIGTNFFKYGDWIVFRQYLQSQGSDKIPEEILDEYKKYYEEYMSHLDRCIEFINKIEKNICEIIDRNKLKFDYGSYYFLALDKDNRKKFAELVKDKKYSAAYFKSIDNNLTISYVMKNLLKTPEDSQLALSYV